MIADVEIEPAPAPAAAKSLPPLTDHTLLVVDYSRSRLHFVDMRSREITGGIDLGHGYWNALCVYRSRVSDEVYAAVAYRDTCLVIHIYELRSGRRVQRIEYDGPTRDPPFTIPEVLCAYFPSDATVPALLLVDNPKTYCIDMLHSESGECVRSIDWRGPSESVSAMAIWTPRDDPAGAQVLVANSTCIGVRFFRLSDGEHVRTICNDTWKDHPFCAMAIYRPAEGRDEDALLVTVGYHNNLLRVYSMASGEYLRTINWGGEGLRCGSSAAMGTVTSPSIAFYRPAGQAETETQLIVSDPGNKRLNVYHLYSGKYMYSMGDYTSRMFGHPLSIALVPTDDGQDGPYLLK